MYLFFVASYARRVALFAVFACVSTIANALDLRQAEQQVKALSCKNAQTVGEVLDGSIRRPSQRDLGWRVFQDQEYYDVERAVLINKGMELRYRWRVFLDGTIKAQSQRAERLCANEDE